MSVFTKFAVVETMTTVQRMGITVRVWRQDGDHGLNNDEAMDGFIRDRIMDLSAVEGTDSFLDLAGKVCTYFHGINAIEVKDNAGNGQVFYPTWP